MIDKTIRATLHFHIHFHDLFRLFTALEHILGSFDRNRVFFFFDKNQIKIDLNVWANQEKRRGKHMPTEFFSNFSLIIKPSQLVRATERALNWTSARSPVDWRATRTVGRLLRHSPSGRNRQLDCGLITCSIFLVDQVPRQIDFQKQVFINLTKVRLG